MPRYIDADTLKERTMMLGLEQGKVEFAVFLCKYIDTEQTADVVPKSEVEMLQGALKAEERHNELTMEMAQKAIQNAKAEVAREIFEEIERICVGMQDYTDYAELKKKYQEGE